MDENITHSRWESAGQVVLALALALASLGLAERFGTSADLILRVTLLQGQLPAKCP